jgi:hypothetical protein
MDQFSAGKHRNADACKACFPLAPRSCEADSKSGCKAGSGSSLSTR